MDRNTPVHPRNRRDGKLQIARDNFAVFFEGVDDDVHAAGRVCRQADLVWLSVDKSRDLRALPRAARATRPSADRLRSSSARNN